MNKRHVHCTLGVLLLVVSVSLFVTLNGRKETHQTVQNDNHSTASSGDIDSTRKGFQPKKSQVNTPDLFPNSNNPDPGKSFESAARIKNKDRKSEALKPFMDSLFAGSPDDALTRIRDLPDGDTKDFCFAELSAKGPLSFLISVLKLQLDDSERNLVNNGLGRRVPLNEHAAVDLVLELGPHLSPKAKDYLASTAGLRAMASSTAIASAMKLPPELRQKYLSGAVSGLSQKQMVDTAVELLAKIEPDSVTEDMVGSVASYYGGSAKQKAIAWALGNPTKLVNRALMGVVASWSQADRSSLEGYAESLAPGNVLDYCARELAGSAETVERQKWVNKIASPDLRLGIPND